MFPGRITLCSAIALSLVTSLAFPSPSTAASKDSWPSFRGEHARGIADGQDLPLTWDADQGTNVRWKLEIPGTSHSSPIVSGGKIFYISAIPLSELPALATKPADEAVAAPNNTRAELDQELAASFSWRIFCIDAETGEPEWDREAYNGKPRISRHPKASQANATPATDGKTIVAIFGSQGVAAYDFAGKLLWRVDLGVLDPGLFEDPGSHWGHASSPTIFGDKVFLQVDRHANSFIAAFDLATGEQQWRVTRDEKPIWATPTIHQADGRTQLIVSGGDFDRGLDPDTGEELWRFARDLEVKTPTPFVAGDLVILAGGYKGKEIFAVSAKSQGLVEGSELAWTSEPGGPYTSTPVAYQDRLFFVRDTGVFNVLDLATGSRLLRERTDGAFSASPIASDGKIYLAGEDGVVRVRSSSPPFAELASSDMGEPCMSTPAVAGGTMYLRCTSTLWALSTDE